MELLSQKMDLFMELITCGQELYTWEYAPDMKLVRTNCPNGEQMHSLFKLGDSFAAFQKYVRRLNSRLNTAPLILSNTLGLSWIAGFELAEERVCRVYLIGPVFTSDVEYRSLEQILYKRGYPDDIMRESIHALRGLPIIPIGLWMKYALMLHYILTGEKIHITDLKYQSENEQLIADDGEQFQSQPRRSTWLAEQTAMRMIEEGRLDYQQSFGHLSASVDFVIPTNAKDHARKLTDSVISFITLCTRAAIRGGLDVETAYYIGDHYIQEAENAATFTELMQVNTAMYDDFIHRVYKLKNAVGISSAVQACCNYIELHLGETLSLNNIATDTGYSEYYLAQKFKKEMGVTVSRYIKQQKAERAKVLLRSTTKSILEISEELGYSNPSHFSGMFREMTNMTPVEFRASKS